MLWTATEGPRQGRLRLGEPHVEAQRAMSPPCASPTSPRLETAHAADELALAPRANRHGVQHVVRDGAIGKCIQFVSHSLEAFDAKCPAAIVTSRVDGPLARRSIAVRQPRHLTLAVRLAMPTSRPHAGERTRPTMAQCRSLRPLRSHCEQTLCGPREVFWGVERDDLEMILFTLHPLSGYSCRTAEILCTALGSADSVQRLWAERLPMLCAMINIYRHYTHDMRYSDNSD